MMLRLWQAFRVEHIQTKRTKCAMCEELAIGDHYDKDWEAVALCGFHGKVWY